ncbi:uncharacterized protein LOC106661335 isoform X2 [Cimex lectularius]|uniref:Nanos-type domain-containing protein n=1 Tax=Cimex lectularius TaxID=79782 RepID=A0A8I6R7W3_CIMLE|nr:uncharacterized protein LOC106661335 isoform X2 [Cimex lectularius]
MKMWPTNPTSSSSDYKDCKPSLVPSPKALPGHDGVFGSQPVPKDLQASYQSSLRPRTCSASSGDSYFVDSLSFERLSISPPNTLPQNEDNIFSANRSGSQDNFLQFSLFGEQSENIMKHASDVQKSIHTKLFDLKQPRDCSILRRDVVIGSESERMHSENKYKKPILPVPIYPDEITNENIASNVQASHVQNPKIKSSPYGLFCSFCYSNKETELMFKGHNLRTRNNSGRNVLSCPVLRRHVCENCGATGDFAHTLTHCPLLIKQLGQKPKALANTLKDTIRDAAGRVRKNTFS